VGRLTGLPVSGQGNHGRNIEADLEENDPVLAKLYAAIEELHQYKPSPWRVVPKAERDRYFGLAKRVTWSAKEIDAAELLMLRNSLLIADHVQPTPEQIAREEYVVRGQPREDGGAIRISVPVRLASGGGAAALTARGRGPYGPASPTRGVRE
jgi:hypothetical protein